jgi:hypothetical protein
MHRGTNCCHMASTLIPEHRTLCMFFVTPLFLQLDKRVEADLLLLLFNELHHCTYGISLLNPTQINKCFADAST